MAKLILVRHGQSTWNAENRFTGWVDVPLSKFGRREAIEAAQIRLQRRRQCRR
jgi:2,3-bisphosphoglycerate-dependent phosphoglycerate mutase